MEFILDFQGFKTNNRDYIIKELAFISTDNQVYELHLFQPPHSFSELSDDEKRQVIWLEKRFHGLYWSSGYNLYSEIKTIFKSCNIKGTIYVKGLEKQKFIIQLLKDFSVNVINIEDLGCPSLSILKRQSQQLNRFSLCRFDHHVTYYNCAHVNVLLLLEWLKSEKTFFTRMDCVSSAIKECYEKGYTHLSVETVKHLPKSFILNYKEDVGIIFNKLPAHLQRDPEIVENLKCDKHYSILFKNASDCFDGPLLKRKDCYLCRASKVKE